MVISFCIHWLSLKRNLPEAPISRVCYKIFHFKCQPSDVQAKSHPHRGTRVERRWGGGVAGHVEYDIIKHFAAFCWRFLHFSPKKGKGKKHAFFNHPLLMTSYLMTITTDSYQTSVKICLRDMRTPILKTAGLDNSSSRKNPRKTLWGVGTHSSTSCTPEG